MLRSVGSQSRTRLGDWTELSVASCGVPRFVCPFTQQRPFALFLVLGNYEYRCYKCFYTGFVWKKFLILYSKYPGMRLRSHGATVRTSVCRAGGSICIPTGSVWAELAAPPPQTCFWSGFPLPGVAWSWRLPVGFTCISVMPNHTKYLLICLFAIHISSSVKCLFRSFAHCI